MTQLVVNIRDEQRLPFVVELLQAFDFIESVSVEPSKKSPEDSDDFFAAAGLWAGRDVSLESIRQKAWARE